MLFLPDITPQVYPKNVPSISSNFKSILWLKPLVGTKVVTKIATSCIPNAPQEIDQNNRNFAGNKYRQRKLIITSAIAAKRPIISPTFNTTHNNIKGGTCELPDRKL